MLDLSWQSGWIDIPDEGATRENGQNVVGMEFVKEFPEHGEEQTENRMDWTYETSVPALSRMAFVPPG